MLRSIWLPWLVTFVILWNDQQSISILAKWQVPCNRLKKKLAWGSNEGDSYIIPRQTLKMPSYRELTKTKALPFWGSAGVFIQASTGPYSNGSNSWAWCIPQIQCHGGDWQEWTCHGLWAAVSACHKELHHQTGRQSLQMSSPQALACQPISNCCHSEEY